MLTLFLECTKWQAAGYIRIGRPLVSELQLVGKNFLSTEIAGLLEVGKKKAIDFHSGKNGPFPRFAWEMGTFLPDIEISMAGFQRHGLHSGTGTMVEVEIHTNQNATWFTVVQKCSGLPV